LTLRWVPGHMDVRGNELADTEAKKAASGISSHPTRLPRILRSMLPASSSALKQHFHKTLKDQAKDSWSKSTRYARMRAIDPLLPGTSFEGLISGLTRKS
ncbi:hypothetical protein OBBRIDRAFT_712456, partial [Obba rivulosa]